jgi:hypothetical protein
LIVPCLGSESTAYPFVNVTALSACNAGFKGADSVPSVGHTAIDTECGFNITRDLRVVEVYTNVPCSLAITCSKAS